MIDRPLRARLVTLLRDLVTGQISNDQFEDSIPGSADPAVEAVRRQSWFTYSDLYEHTLTGPKALSSEARAALDRSIKFLQSDHEYEWPPVPLEGLSRAVFTIATFGVGARLVDRPW
jgi:hypothetical protein